MTPARAGATLAMLVSAFAIYGLASSSAFGFSALRIEGTTVTPDDAIRARLGVDPGGNLFSIATEPIEVRLSEIPAIAAVDVAIGLPGTLDVRVVEREPILAWQVGERRLLMDSAGFAFAELAGPPPAAIAGLPVVVDERASSRALAVSSTLDAIDLDAATRLASLTPAEVGSSARGLAVGVTDDNGFVIKSVPESWIAVFGIYVRSLRTPDLIDDQVQLLAHLLAGREATVAKVILADAREGTFIPKASPAPSATPKP